MDRNTKACASKTWIALGGLLALGLTFMIMRELPSIRRELRLIRM